MAADRRVLIIGVLAVVVFVAIGVTSAAVFTTSGCERIGPEVAAVPTAVAVQDRPAVASTVDTLGAELGPVQGAWDLGTTGGSSTPVELVLLGDGRAAVRDGTIMVVDVVDGPVAAARFSPPAHVVGDGAHLFSLARTNELTGQVDALTALDGRLVAGGCLDTAVVGSPLAFHLDAGAGELLLLRVAEDGADPVLELRHPADGPVWRADLATPAQPPGILAERVSASLGEQLVVAGRRFSDGEAGVVTAHTRTDGATVWQLDADDLPTEDADTWSVEVHDAVGSPVLLGLGDDATTRRLVALSTDDGSPVWSFAVDGPYEVVRSGGLTAVVVADGEPGVIVVADDPAAWQTRPQAWPGVAAAFPIDRRLLLAGAVRTELVGAEGTVTLPAVPIVAAVGDEHATFVVIADGDRRLLVVFAAA